MEVPKWCRWITMIALPFLCLTQLWSFQNTFQCKVEEKYEPLWNTKFTTTRKLVQHFSDELDSHSHIIDMELEMEIMRDHLRKSVEFYPLKDRNVDALKEPDRTWFMSTLRGKYLNGYPESFYFPSEASGGKILCFNGTGKSTSYGFAWPKYLPLNSTLLPGLTFISDSFWDYQNPWHSMINMACHEAWRMENQCRAAERFVLYQKGHLEKKMGSWVSSLMEAVMKRKVKPNELDYGGGVVCFEEAAIYRRNLGHMSLENRLAMFDMIRCKAREFCNVGELKRVVNGTRTVNLTLLARTGARSFKNESRMVSLVAEECKKVAGCNFKVFHIANLSFCQQVEALSMTDILVTTHGAQQTNMIFMSRGSSVMEMFPRGWLEGAGVGQYVYHWLAIWSGMVHEGAYRDNEGPDCPTPNDPRQCFSYYKDTQVGYNQTYVAHWTANVLAKFQNRTSATQESHHSKCNCD